MRHRAALAYTSGHFTSERRTLSLFKSDHPRPIDRFIDYFGNDASRDGRTPSGFSHERSGSLAR